MQLNEPERGEGAIFAIREATAQDVLDMGDETIWRLLQEVEDLLIATPVQQPAP